MARTQTERVLAALRNAGSRGITQADFDHRPADGGKPIRRLAARVNELRNEGYSVATTGTRNQFAVYVLTNPLGGPE